MKVLFVVHWFPKLSETFVINQIAGLLERGIEVTIYSRWMGDTTKMHPAVTRLGLLERVLYAHREREEEFEPRAHQQHREDVGLVHLQHAHPAVTGFVQAYARSTGVRVFDEETRRLFYACVEVFRRAPFDVIHCQFGTLVDEALFLKRATGSKLVVSFRGFDITSYVRRRGTDIYRCLFNVSDAVLPNCDYFKRRLVEIGCSEEKLTLLRSGTDTERFPYNPAPLKPGERVRILTVGRLVEKKGIAYGIQAVAKLLKAGRRLEYCIVGEGELRGRLEGLIEELGVREHVRLLGAKEPSDIVHLLGRAHVFLAPSVTAPNGDQDGPPNVLKEAMLTGLPVVATNHGGIPELVEHDASGILVPEGDATALAAGLEALLEHPERWSAMGRRGRRMTERRYDARRLNLQLAALYERLLS